MSILYKINIPVNPTFTVIRDCPESGSCVLSTGAEATTAFTPPGSVAILWNCSTAVGLLYPILSGWYNRNIINKSARCSFNLIFFEFNRPIPNQLGRFSNPSGQSAVVFSDSSGYRYHESGSAVWYAKSSWCSDPVWFLFFVSLLLSSKRGLSDVNQIEPSLLTDPYVPN
jgi:hypothetical protein